MIAARAARGETILDVEVFDGATAYFDAEWIPTDGSGPLPALLVRSGVDDPDAAAAARLEGFVRDVAAAVQQHAHAGSVEVAGDGVVASYARELLGAARFHPDGTGERPAVVVDTTGDPLLIAAASRRLQELGVVVLAGEPLGRRLTLNLYPDVHSRGLRLHGVPSAVGPIADRVDSHRRGPLPSVFAETLTEIAPGSALAARTGWYRCSGVEAVPSPAVLSI